MKRPEAPSESVLLETVRPELLILTTAGLNSASFYQQ